MLPLVFFFMTTNKKQQRYPLCFFSWRPIKNDSVTPYVSFHDDQSSIKRIYKTLKCMCVSIISLMFFIMRTNIKRQCYPLCFFSWRPIKNDSVTPYVFFDKKPIKNDSVTPYVFFHDDQYKTTVLPLMFLSWRPIKNNSVTPYVAFHGDQQ